jgi:mannosyl-glycoprotein endo-beta-N-acetylglucosaminidase
MKKRVLAVLVLVLLLATILPVISASAVIGPQYVYTSNGKGLNLRSGPSKDYEILTTIPYGTELTGVAYYDSSWSQVSYNGYSGYVMSRYLSSTKPSSKPTPTPKPSSESLYKDFYKADYYVTVRPSTPSGYVNLRWGPSKSIDVENTYYAGASLHVLAENSTWAQLYDQATGTCGFMMREFLTDAGDGAGG